MCRACDGAKCEGVWEGINRITREGFKVLYDMMAVVDVLWEFLAKWDMYWITWFESWFLELLHVDSIGWRGLGIGKGSVNKFWEGHRKLEYMETTI